MWWCWWAQQAAGAIFIVIFFHVLSFVFLNSCVLICVVVLVGTMCNLYFRHFCNFALLHFQHFFLESFDLCGGVGGHNGQEVQRDGVKIAASQPPLVYSM